MTNKNSNYDRILPLLIPTTGNLIRGFLMLGEFSLVEVRIMTDSDGNKIKIYQDDNLHILIRNPNNCLISLEVLYNLETGKNNLLISWRDSQNKRETIKIVEKIKDLNPEFINRLLTCYPDNQ